jgi:hypothetical protein
VMGVTRAGWGMVSRGGPVGLSAWLSAGVDV